MNTMTPAKWHIDLFEDIAKNRAQLEMATKKLLDLGFPNAKMEHYRYFSIVPVLSKDYRFVEQKDQEIEQGETINIVDSTLQKAPNIDILINNERSLDEEHFDPIYYISHILSPKVIDIRVKKDEKIIINHSFTEESSLMAYRINIVVEEGAKLLLDERFDKKMPKESLVLGGFDIELKEGSSIEWIREQSCDSESFAMLGSHSVRVSKGADCKIGTFDFGEGRIVHNLKVELDEDSRSDLSHLLYGNGGGQRGNITLVEHKGNSATTKQNARHILRDSARGIFDAIIRVDHEGKYAKTDQNTRSILLNDGAYMISKPQLEIYIDELEASHGSTTGEIDPAQLFYLRSRGIGKKEAKRILIYAFAKDLIESVGDEQIQNRLIDEFEKIYKKGEE